MKEIIKALTKSNISWENSSAFLKLVAGIDVIMLIIDVILPVKNIMNIMSLSRGFAIIGIFLSIIIFELHKRKNITKIPKIIATICFLCATVPFIITILIIPLVLLLNR